MRLAANWREEKKEGIENEFYVLNQLGLVSDLQWENLFVWVAFFSSSSPEARKGAEMCHYKYNTVFANHRYFLKRQSGEGWLRPVCCLQGLWNNNCSLYMLCPCHSHKSMASWRLGRIRRRRRRDKVEWGFSLSPVQSPLKFFPQLCKLLSGTSKGHIYEMGWYLVSGVRVHPLDVMQFQILIPTKILL